MQSDPMGKYEIDKGGGGSKFHWKPNVRLHTTG